MLGVVEYGSDCWMFVVLVVVGEWFKLDGSLTPCLTVVGVWECLIRCSTIHQRWSTRLSVSFDACIGTLVARVVVDVVGAYSIMVGFPAPCLAIVFSVGVS